MTTIYVFDPVHFTLVGEISPRIDPISKKELLPSIMHDSRTIVPPPGPMDGYSQVFNRETQTWFYAENHDGETVYNKLSGEEFMLELGRDIYQHLGPIPEGWTPKKPLDVPCHWDEKAGAWIEDSMADFDRRKAIEDDVKQFTSLLSVITSSGVDEFVRQSDVRHLVSSIIKVMSLGR